MRNKTYNGGGVGYSDDALNALIRGQYREYSGNRQSKYHTSKEQLEPTQSIPYLKGMESNITSDRRNSIDTDRARRKYEQRINYSPLNSSNDDNYVVKRDRYDKLMQDGRLANDIKTLATLNFNNANTDATVSQEWADEYGAKKITGGYTKKQFIDTLSRRYGLTAKELDDMALTFHSDANKAETEKYGKDLEKLGENHSVVGSLGSFVGTLGSGVEGAYNTVVGGLTNDDRFLSNMFRTTKNSLREGAKKNIKSNAGKTAYDITMGIGDMGVGAAAGSAPVVLAGNTANEAMSSSLERGSNVRKSAGYGALAGTLDYFTNKVGLDKAKKLAVNSIKSAGIKKFLAQNAIAGAGEGLENVIQDLGQTFVDEIINGKNSELSKSYENKIANGMSASEAFNETAKEYARNVALSAGIGFGMGSAMQGGSSLLPNLPMLKGMGKATPATNEALVDLLASDKKYKAMFTANTGIKLGNSVEKNKAIITDYLLNSVGQKKIDWKSPAELEAEKANISDQVDRLENKERVRNMLNENGVQFPTRKAQNDSFFNSNVSAGEENVNPRFIKALEGEELNNAKAQKKANKDKINALKNEIDILQKDPKNLYRGNLKKAVQADIRAKEAEIRKLQSDNKGIDQQIKGGLKPVKDMLSKDQKDAIYGMKNSVFSDINLATKFAGDTPEAKAIANRAKAAVRAYVNTGTDEAIRELSNALMELDTLAKSTNAEYVTKAGNRWTYETRFGEQAKYLSNLQPVADIYNAEKAAKKAGQSAPKKTPAPEAPQNPRLQEIDENLAQIEEKLKQYGGSETNTDVEKYHTDIRAIDERLERLKDGVLPYEELVKSSANIPEAINDLYSQRAMLLSQLDQIQDGMTTTLPSGRQHRMTAQELADHRANIRYLIKQTDNQIIDNTNRFLLATREAARNNLESASAPIEDALAGNVRRQLEQTRERLLKEHQSLQNGGGDNGNEPPRVPEAPTEDINRTPTEEMSGRSGNNNVPPNEPPVPPEVPPTPNNPETDISRRYETLRKSDLFTKSEENMKMLDTAKEQGIFNKDVESRKKSQAEALKEYLENEEEVTRNNFDKDWDSGKDVDTAMLILHDALDSGSQANTDLALLKQAIQAKKAGRVLRGMRDYAYSGTKEGTLSKVGDYLVDKAEKVLKNKKTGAEYKSMAEKIVKGDMSILSKLDMDETNAKRIQDAVANGASAQDIETMLATYKAVGTTGVSREALDKVNELYKQIEKLPPTSKARADLEADVFKVLAQDIGGKRTWREQWDAWRYLAMLGNPKTHLRNILGNITHNMVTEVKDVLGATIEGAVDKANRAMGGKGIERTKALLNADDQGLIDLAKKDADDVAYASLNDMGNKYNVKNEISRARNSFNNKTLSKIDDFNSNMLDLEDYSALKRKYSKSLARFLKANGADESIFNATDDASKALLDKGRAYAVDQAKQATFHEYSKLAEALTQFSQKMQEDNKLSHKAAGYVLEGLLPFKKTPINILKQGAKYSPVELVKSIGKIYKAVKGGESASDAIESLASGLTGSGIYALGAFLASQGMLTGSQDDNYTVDNAQTEQGAQNYALKFGDNSYTMDWLAPLALPLFAGVETYNLMTKERGDDEGVFDAIVDGISTIAEPVTEMSMLQGINNTLESLSYSGLKSAIGTFGASALTGYMTQGVPTLAGQLARTFDNTRRSTYSDEDSAVRRQIDKSKTKVENKIPFLSMSNEPYIDSRGQVQQNEGLASYFLGDNYATRMADQMLSPGYFKSGTVTDVDKELNRLYDATGTSVYRKVSSGKVGDNRLSKQDFTKYQTLYGQTTDELYNTIIGSQRYNQLDDTEKTQMLTSAQDLAKNLSDSEIGGKVLDKSAQKLVDLYKSEGAEAVSNYLADTAAAKSLGLTHDTYIKKEAEYPGGAAAYAEDKAKAKTLGLDTDTYIKQEQNNPNGAEGYAQDREAAKAYGFVDKNGAVKTDAYEKARELFGNDDRAIRKSQEFKDNGITKAAEKIPELIKDNTLSNEAKGKLLIGDAKSIKGVKKQMFDMGGYEGAYYYYLIKNQADADGNGNVKKAERNAYFEGESQYLDDLWALDQDMYYYLMNNLK